MGVFKGYLLKAVETNKKFPNNYILYQSWKSTPNQREEIDAYRDDNTRELFRFTAEGEKSIFSFQTKPGMHLADKMAIQDFFVSAESNHKERKVKLEYWNDEDNQYEQGDFYRPNLEFPIRKITEDDIIYEALTLDFVEY